MSAALRLVEQFIEHTFPATGPWKTRTVEVMRNEADEVYVNVYGVIGGKELAADVQMHRLRTLQKLRPRQYEDVLSKLSSQRWIGPYRWRKRPPGWPALSGCRRTRYPCLPM